MIRYVDHITPEEYMELRRRVGWMEFPLEEARNCVENAYMVLCVRDDEEAVIKRIKDDMKPGYKVKLNLNSAKGKEPFYEKFGFKVRPNEEAGAGMDQWLTLEN